MPVMGHFRILAVMALMLISAPAPAAAMAKPATLNVEIAAVPRFVWTAVDGAKAYRLAVFDEPDAEGKRPLLAAVWVRSTAWLYAKDPVLSKVGTLPSTQPQALPQGRKLHAMVRAVGEDGADPSDWTGADFRLKPSAVSLPSATPTPTPSPTPGAGTKAAPAAAADAEMEVDSGEEFKSSPEPTVIDVDESEGHTTAAAQSPTAQSASFTAKAAAAPQPTALPTVEPTMENGQALINAGRWEDAETVFRALTEKMPKNADAWEGLGDSYAARHQKTEAAESYGKALKYDDSKTRLKGWFKKNMGHD